MNTVVQFAFCALVAAVILRWYCSHHFVTSHQAKTVEDIVGHVPLRPELVSFIEDDGWTSEPQFLKVADGVFVAIRYAYGNCVILEGPQGLVVVDTTESRQAAEQIRTRLRAVSSKPISAIIYTHFHPDHIQGTQAFIEDPDNPPDIYSHYLLPEALNSRLIIKPKYARGMVYQLGFALGKAQVWPVFPRGFSPTVPRLPNKLIRQDIETVSVAGLNLTFLAIPGETEDHLVIWLADRRILLSADNFYKAFPNLYPIRGISNRDCLIWADAIRSLRSLHAEILIPQHGYPITDQQQIHSDLSSWISAIQYVHDQTVRHMNKQLHPDEIANVVKLPASLASHPYLQERYGRVDWSAKSIYQRYIGWFSGDPVDLGPLTPTERAQRLIDALGAERLLAEAETALRSAESLQWALELSTHVVRIDPDNDKARRVRLDSLRRLAAEQTNPAARNFYLTAALDDHGLVDINTEMDSKTDVALLLDVLKVQLKAEMTDNVNTTFYLHFEDSKRTFRLQMLYSVLNVDNASPSDDNGDLLVTTSELVWKQLMTGDLPAATAFTDGSLRFNADPQILKQFLSYFDI